MKTRNEIIIQLNAEYAARVAAAKQRAEDNRLALYEKFPCLEEWEAQRRALTVRMARRIVNDESADAEKAELARIGEEINGFFAKNGIDSAVLEPQYRCQSCSDTGRTADGKECSCYKNELLRRICPQLEDECGSFERFDLNVFPEENGQRATMAKLERFGIDYADNFPASTYRCLTFCGETGLGKTFLINSMARRIAQRGFTVMRITAFRLMEELRAEHTGKSERGAFREMLNAELLVIDDLGTEPVYNNITHEYLFSLINERMSLRLHTVISTNLDLGDIRQRYGERIYSRLSDSASSALIRLKGMDVRKRK